MKLKEIYDKIDALYPKKISDDYIAAFGGHDNSGILIDAGKDISGAVCSLDFSQGAIDAAITAGANLIVTHHPAIFFPIANLRADDAPGARLLRAIEAGIGVVSMHLNLDCTEGGIDESLAEAVGAQDEIHVCERFESGGYGRIYGVKRQTFSQFCASLMNELKTHRAFLYGAETEEICKVASFCGAGVDAGAISAAKRCGADAIVSADIKHNFICDALESGLKVVQLTHYASENYGFKKIYQQLEGVLGIPCAYHEDEYML